MARYEPEERPPLLTSLGLGAQSALLVVAPIALFPIVLMNAAGGSAQEVAWVVFAMLAVNGAATILQAFRNGPVGSGMLVITYPSPTAIPFCIIALQEGGASTLASLILATGIFQILVSMRLAQLRRLVTPAISGAILILLIITIVPVVFRELGDVPEGAPAAAGPVCVLVTFALTVGLLMRGSGAWRVWSALIGIAAGAAAGAAFGIFDFGPAREAAVAGLPLEGWPGLSLSFGVAFWSLLPAFLFLALISLLQGTSIALSMQRLSWRKPRAMELPEGAGAVGMHGGRESAGRACLCDAYIHQSEGKSFRTADGMRFASGGSGHGRVSDCGGVLPQVVEPADRDSGAGDGYFPGGDAESAVD